MRVALFIDGNNFYHGFKSIYGESKKPIEFSFAKFASLLSKNRKVVDIFYYNAQLDRLENLKKFQSQKRFFENLRKISNLRLILCRLLKRRTKGTREYYYVLKEDDIHMAVDMVEGAADDKFDVAVLVSGDGDFVPAVKAVQRKNKKVENVYFKKSSSRNLMQHCDNSLELTKEFLDKCFTQESMPLTREEAIELLKKYNSIESRQDWNHFLESEAIMRGVALRLGENEEEWGMLGLLHDVDWGITKENTVEHLTKAPVILFDAGFDEGFIKNIVSHGCGFECAGLKDKKRSGKVQHALAACETLTGLIHAYALMRGGRVSDMEVKGLKKKFKDKTFASGCSREIISEIEDAGLSVDEFFEVGINAVSKIKGEVGLG